VKSYNIYHQRSCCYIIMKKMGYRFRSVGDQKSDGHQCKVKSQQLGQKRY
jgi:hypothetical protein